MVTTTAAARIASTGREREHRAGAQRLHQVAAAQQLQAAGRRHHRAGDADADQQGQQRPRIQTLAQVREAASVHDPHQEPGASR